jgi:hypothetical protein
VTSEVQEDNYLLFVTATIEYPVILAIFFLSCWADPKPKDIALEGNTEKNQIHEKVINEMQ